MKEIDAGHYVCPECQHEIKENNPEFSCQCAHCVKCGPYKRLVQVWLRAVHQENIALDPGAGKVTSARQLIEDRKGAKAERLKSEYAIEVHVKSCDLCTAQGNKPQKVYR